MKSKSGAILMITCEGVCLFTLVTTIPLITINGFSNSFNLNEKIPNFQASCDAYKYGYGPIWDEIKKPGMSAEGLKNFLENDANETELKKFINALSTSSASLSFEDVYNSFKNNGSWPNKDDLPQEENEILKIETKGNDVVISLKNNIVDIKTALVNNKLVEIAQKAAEENWTESQINEDIKKIDVDKEEILNKFIWNEKDKTLTIKCNSSTIVQDNIGVNPIKNAAALYNAWASGYGIIFKCVITQHMTAKSLKEELDKTKEDLGFKLTSTSNSVSLNQICNDIRKDKNLASHEWYKINPNPTNNIVNIEEVENENKVNIVFKDSSILDFKDAYKYGPLFLYTYNKAIDNQDIFDDEFWTTAKNQYKTAQEIFEWDPATKTLTITCKNIEIKNAFATYKAFNDFYVKIYNEINKNNISAIGLVKLLKDNSTISNSLIDQSDNIGIRDIYDYYCKDSSTNQPKWEKLNSNGNSVADDGIKIDSDNNKNVIIKFKNTNIIEPNNENFKNACLYFLAKEAAEKKWTDDEFKNEENKLFEKFKLLQERFQWNAKTNTLTICCKSNFNLANDEVENASSLYNAYSSCYCKIVDWVVKEKMSPERLKVELEDPHNSLSFYLTSTSLPVSLKKIFEDYNLNNYYEWYKNTISDNKVSNIEINDQKSDVIITFENNNIRNWENALKYGPYFNYTLRVASGEISNNKENQDKFIHNEIKNYYEKAKENKIFQIDDNKLIIKCISGYVNDDTKIPNAFALNNAWSFYGRILMELDKNNNSAAKIKEFLDNLDNQYSFTENLFDTSDPTSVSQVKKDLENVINSQLNKNEKFKQIYSFKWYNLHRRIETATGQEKWNGFKEVKLNPNNNKVLEVTFKETIYNWKDVLVYGMKFDSIFRYYTRLLDVDSSIAKSEIENGWKKVQEKINTANETFEWNASTKTLSIICKSQ